MSVSDQLFDFAETAIEREIVAAVHKHGGIRRAARHVEHSYGFVQKNYKRVKDRAALKGWSPEHDLTHAVAPGQKLRGASTLYDMSTGEAKLQWVKSTAHQEVQEAIAREFVDALATDLPAKAPVQAQGPFAQDLMTVIPIADLHAGMYAFADECGENYDIDVATSRLCGAVDYLVKQAPRSGRCVLLNCGDFFHASNFEGVTSRSKNILDMDTRMPRVIRLGMFALMQCIESALEHHETVELVNTIGNHDELLACMMSTGFDLAYREEPRVIVSNESPTRHYLQHGKVLIGVTHGHQTKDRDLPGIMAAERPQQWGETKYRFFYRGHHHHSERMEYNGCVVEQFRTVAPGDAYAVSHGHLSKSDMNCIVMHRERGEVQRVVFNPEMLEQPGAA